MDEDRDGSVEGHPSAAPDDAVVGPRSARSSTRARHALPSQVVATGWMREPGLVLVAGSVALGVGAAVALAVGWGALLFVVALVQVLLARAWTDYLEIPGAVAAAVGIVVIAALADAGVVVSRVVDDSEDRAPELLQLAPALGVVFLVAILVQLLRRDGREGMLAGLIAVVTGGVLAVGLAVWLPLEASAAGDRWVAAGFAFVAAVGVLVGGAAWVRQARVPGPALLLPVLLALLAGPFYVVGRIVAG